MRRHSARFSRLESRDVVIVVVETFLSASKVIRPLSSLLDTGHHEHGVV